MSLALYRWCDIVLSHNQFAPFAVFNACQAQKPLVLFVRNDWPTNLMRFIREDSRAADVGAVSIVYSAEWIRDSLRFPHPSMVLRPPVRADNYLVERTGVAITLVNCMEEKGGNVLVRLAHAMPRRDFLGVKGPYGKQVIGEVPNLRYVECTADARAVYRRTRILLCPSKSEGFCRASVEAMCSGIPVIAHPIPGLIEPLGEAGLFAHRDKIDDWISTIATLDEPDVYELASERCRRRARDLDSEPELLTFERFLFDLLGRNA